MSLVLEQRFLLGRFHATRWNQNPFEDRYGEWPPSPWRLLRALMARWFQYSRETGDENECLRDELLQSLAARPPAYFLPPYTWRGEPALRQYHKTGVDWTAKGKKDAAYKKAMTSLAIDHYRAIPVGQSVIWYWERLTLPAAEAALLQALVRLVLYFGRAETFCKLSMLDELPHGITPNCVLDASAKDQVPVLVADPNVSFQPQAVLMMTDDEAVSSKPIPIGTAWHYARLPQCPTSSPRTRHPAGFPAGLNLVQFAIGGRVYPPQSQWVRVAERFRGRVLRNLACTAIGRQSAQYRDLDSASRQRISLMSGKDGLGNALNGHPHAYFAVIPDDLGLPTRFACWRDQEFSDGEINALLGASRHALRWQPATAGWEIQLVPLPFDVAAPYTCDGSSQTWISATPFVVPGNRRRFRRSGRERPGETPIACLAKLLAKNGFPRPRQLVELTPPRGLEWVAVHESQAERAKRRDERARAVKRGFRFQIEFDEPVRGPICLGHSSHFGMGLFLPATDQPRR